MDHRVNRCNHYWLYIFSKWEKDEDTAVNEIDYKSQPYLGEKSAPVQIVEFGDYKCPVCKTFEEQFFPSIQSELIDTGKAQFYFMNYSFINVDSTRSAKFAESVYQELGNETFWKFHELLFDKQPADLKYEKEDVFTDKFLEETLKEIANDKDVKKSLPLLKPKSPRTNGTRIWSWPTNWALLEHLPYLSMARSLKEIQSMI